MGKGKYQSKRQANWPLIILGVVILVILVLGVVLLLKSCGGDAPDAGQTNPVVTDPVAETTEPEVSETEPTEPTETDPPETDPTEPEVTETEPSEPTETESTEPEPTETEPEPTETEPEPTEAPTQPAASKGQEVADMALSLVGKPEKSEEHPEGFDVGSFVAYCFRQCGFAQVPTDFNALLRYGTEVEEGQNGDLVVFHITPQEGEPYDYMGIVVEEDQFIAVSSSSEMVVKRPLSQFTKYPTVYRRFPLTQP